ncbi:MAG TPA: hypothetical protein VKU39_07430 [Streptosporangiaceae bacterium]|nr:hypothetical protein [Streptosporangiaceae bacterium]
MTTYTDEYELETLSAYELHDLASRRALQETDAGFLWDLLRAVSAADVTESQSQDTVRAEMIVLAGLICDALGHCAIADRLRPLYIGYLKEHGIPS